MTERLVLYRLLETVLKRDGEILDEETDYINSSEELPSLWCLLKADRNDFSGLLKQWKSVMNEALSKEFAVVIKADCVEKYVKIDLVESWLVYFPLCLSLLRRCREKLSQSCRLLVGVGGSAAAGKTTFCCIVSKILDQLLAEDDLKCKVVGMDAYHLPNERLIEIGLKHLKGRPNTFDVRSLSDSVVMLKSLHNSPLSLPVYDRKLHNPRPDVVTIGTDCPLVLIEGLFILCSDERWIPVSSELDFKIFLQVPLYLCEQRAVERKSMGNKISRDEAQAHFCRVDKANFSFIEQSSAGVDIILGLGKDCKFTHTLVNCT
jgi:pantothenate kinase